MGKGELAVKETCGLVQTQMTTQQLLLRKKEIQDIQSRVMTEGIDYGVIPGCAKPSLLKPGAETLNVTFGLRPILSPATDIKEVDLIGGHKEFQVTVHILSANGVEIATGIGSCSTMETKYRYRKAEQKCPECGKQTIRKGSKQYGGGWYCNKKDGGCGARFKDGDERIENQEMGRIEYDNPADYYNTCLKMAKKRALIDGTINATAVSHIFTQDVEDMGKEIIKDAEYIDASPVEQTEAPADNPPADKPTEKKPAKSTASPNGEEIKHWRDGDAKRGTCSKCGKKDVFCYIEGGLCYDCKHA